MSYQHPLGGLALAIVAAAVFGLALPDQSIANSSFKLNLSFSESVLAAAGTPQQDEVDHYESWDSAIARIRKRNMPFIEVTNTSSMATPMTQFKMTIPKPQYEFGDNVLSGYAQVGTTTPDVQFTSSSPDDGTTLIVNFTNGLQPNEVVRFQVDIDVDENFPDLYPYPDYRMVFFDVNGNDTSDNSVITASFEQMGGGTTSVSQTLPDFTQPTPVFLNGGPLREYNQMDPAENFGGEVEIPEPAAGVLALVVTSTLGAFRRRRLVG